MYKFLCSNLTKPHRTLSNFTGYYRKVAQKNNKPVSSGKKFVSDTNLQRNKKENKNAEPVECPDDILETDIPTIKKPKSYTSFFSQRISKNTLCKFGNRENQFTVFSSKYLYTTDGNKRKDAAPKKHFKNREAECYYKFAIDQCMDIKNRQEKLNQQARREAEPPKLIQDIKNEMKTIESRMRLKQKIAAPSLKKNTEQERKQNISRTVRISEMQTRKPCYQFKPNKVKITYPTMAKQYKLGTFKIQEKIKEEVVANAKTKTIYKDPVPQRLKASSVKHGQTSEKDIAIFEDIKARPKTKKLPIIATMLTKQYEAKKEKAIEQSTVKQHPTVEPVNASTRMAFKKRYNKILQRSGLVYKPEKEKEKESDEKNENILSKDMEDKNSEDKLETSPQQQDPTYQSDTTSKLFKKLFKSEEPESALEPKMTEHPMTSDKPEIQPPMKYPKRILSEKSESFDIESTCIKTNNTPANSKTLGNYDVESDEKIRSFVESHKDQIQQEKEAEQADKEEHRNRIDVGKAQAASIAEYLDKLKALRDQTAVDNIADTPKKTEPLPKLEGRKIKEVVRQFEQIIEQTPLDKPAKKNPIVKNLKQYPISENIDANKDTDKIIKRATSRMEKTRSQSLVSPRQMKTSPPKRLTLLKSARSEISVKKPRQRSATPQQPSKYQKDEVMQELKDDQVEKEQNKTINTLNRIMAQYKLPLKNDGPKSTAEIKRMNRRRRKEAERKIKGKKDEKITTKQQKVEVEATQEKPFINKGRKHKYCLESVALKTSQNETIQDGDSNITDQNTSKKDVPDSAEEKDKLKLKALEGKPQQKEQLGEAVAEQPLINKNPTEINNDPVEVRKNSNAKKTFISKRLEDTLKKKTATVENKVQNETLPDDLDQFEGQSNTASKEEFLKKEREILHTANQSSKNTNDSVNKGDTERDNPENSVNNTIEDQEKSAAEPSKTNTNNFIRHNKLIIKKPSFKTAKKRLATTETKEQNPKEDSKVEEKPSELKPSEKPSMRARLSKYHLDNMAKLKEASSRLVKMVTGVDAETPTSKLEDGTEKSIAPENRPTIPREIPKEPNEKEKNRKEKPKSKTELVLPPKGQIDPQTSSKCENVAFEDPKTHMLDEINKGLCKGPHKYRLDTFKGRMCKSLVDLAVEQKSKILEEIETQWNMENNKFKQNNEAPLENKTALGIQEEKNQLEKEAGNSTMNINKRKCAKEYELHKEVTKKTVEGDLSKPRLIVKLRYVYPSKRKWEKNELTKTAESNSTVSESIPKSASLGAIKSQPSCEEKNINNCNISNTGAAQAEAISDEKTTNNVNKPVIQAATEVSSTSAATSNVDNIKEQPIGKEETSPGLSNNAGNTEPQPTDTSNSNDKKLLLETSTPETIVDEQVKADQLSCPTYFQTKTVQFEDSTLTIDSKLRPNKEIIPKDVLWHANNYLDLCFAKLKKSRIEDEFLIYAKQKQDTIEPPKKKNHSGKDSEGEDYAKNVSVKNLEASYHASTKEEIKQAGELPFKKQIRRKIEEDTGTTESLIKNALVSQKESVPPTNRSLTLEQKQLEDSSLQSRKNKGRIENDVGRAKVALQLNPSAFEVVKDSLSIMGKETVKKVKAESKHLDNKPKTLQNNLNQPEKTKSMGTTSDETKVKENRNTILKSKTLEVIRRGRSVPKSKVMKNHTRIKERPKTVSALITRKSLSKSEIGSASTRKFAQLGDILDRTRDTKKILQGMKKADKELDEILKTYDVFNNRAKKHHGKHVKETHIDQKKKEATVFANITKASQMQSNQNTNKTENTKGRRARSRSGRVKPKIADNVLKGINKSQEESLPNNNNKSLNILDPKTNGKASKAIKKPAKNLLCNNSQEESLPNQSNKSLSILDPKTNGKALKVINKPCKNLLCNKSQEESLLNHSNKSLSILDPKTNGKALKAINKPAKNLLCLDNVSNLKKNQLQCNMDHAAKKTSIMKRKETVKGNLILVNRKNLLPAVVKVTGTDLQVGSNEESDTKQADCKDDDHKNRGDVSDEPANTKLTFQLVKDGKEAKDNKFVVTIPEDTAEVAENCDECKKEDTVNVPGKKQTYVRATKIWPQQVGISKDNTSTRKNAKIRFRETKIKNNLKKTKGKQNDKTKMVVFEKQEGMLQKKLRPMEKDVAALKRTSGDSGLKRLLTPTKFRKNLQEEWKNKVGELWNEKEHYTKSDNQAEKKKKAIFAISRSTLLDLFLKPKETSPYGREEKMVRTIFYHARTMVKKAENLESNPVPSREFEPITPKISTVIAKPEIPESSCPKPKRKLENDFLKNEFKQNMKETKQKNATFSKKNTAKKIKPGTLTKNRHDRKKNLLNATSHNIYNRNQINKHETKMKLTRKQDVSYMDTNLPKNRSDPYNTCRSEPRLTEPSRRTHDTKYTLNKQLKVLKSVTSPRLSEMHRNMNENTSQTCTSSDIRYGGPNTSKSAKRMTMIMENRVSHEVSKMLLEEKLNKGFAKSGAMVKFKDTALEKSESRKVASQSMETSEGKAVINDNVEITKAMDSIEPAKENQSVSVDSGRSDVEKGSSNGKDEPNQAIEGEYLEKKICKFHLNYLNKTYDKVKHILSIVKDENMVGDMADKNLDKIEKLKTTNARNTYFSKGNSKEDNSVSSELQTRDNGQNIHDLQSKPNFVECSTPNDTTGKDNTRSDMKYITANTDIKLLTDGKNVPINKQEAVKRDKNMLDCSEDETTKTKGINEEAKHRSIIVTTKNKLDSIEDNKNITMLQSKDKEANTKHCNLKGKIVNEKWRNNQTHKSNFAEDRNTSNTITQISKQPEMMFAELKQLLIFEKLQNDIVSALQSFRQSKNYTQIINDGAPNSFESVQAKEDENKVGNKEQNDKAKTTMVTAQPNPTPIDTSVEKENKFKETKSTSKVNPNAIKSDHKMLNGKIKHEEKNNYKYMNQRILQTLIRKPEENHESKLPKSGNKRKLAMSKPQLQERKKQKIESTESQHSVKSNCYMDLGAKKVCNKVFSKANAKQNQKISDSSEETANLKEETLQPDMIENNNVNKVENKEESKTLSCEVKPSSIAIIVDKQKELEQLSTENTAAEERLKRMFNYYATKKECLKTKYPGEQELSMQKNNHKKGGAVLVLPSAPEDKKNSLIPSPFHTQINNKNEDAQTRVTETNKPKKNCEKASDPSAVSAKDNTIKKCQTKNKSAELATVKDKDQATENPLDMKDSSRPYIIKKVSTIIVKPPTFAERLVQKLGLEDEPVRLEIHKTPTKAKIEEILNNHSKEDDKIFKFNRNLVRHFQSRKDPYISSDLRKSYRERSKHWSMLKTYNKHRKVVQPCKDEDDTSMVQHKRPEQPKRSGTFFIERSPPNRYETWLNKTKPPQKPVTRSCERLCLPLKNISQTAMKPSVEEITTLNRDKSETVLVAPKTDPTLSEKYKGLKITQIVVKRQRNRSKESFLPTVLLMKKTKQASEKETVNHEPGNTRKQIIELRYELLQKLHKEFSDVCGHDFNNNIGRFDRVSQYYNSIKGKIKTESNEEITIKPLSKTVEELLGPCPKPSFERVSKYYSMILQKGTKGEKTKNIEEKTDTGDTKAIDETLNNALVLVQKFSKETTELDETRNTGKGAHQMLAKNSQKEKKGKEPPEDTKKKS